MSQASESILVVEDEPFIRMIAVEMLADLGVPVHEAADAGEALKLLDSEPHVSVLFTDINMPGDMDGLSLARVVHERKPHVHIIVTSGKHRIAAADLPHGIFLPKPYSYQSLLDVMQERVGGTH